MSGLNYLSKGPLFIGKLTVVKNVEYKQSVCEKLDRVNTGDTSEQGVICT